MPSSRTSIATAAPLRSTLIATVSARACFATLAIASEAVK